MDFEIDELVNTSFVKGSAEDAVMPQIMTLPSRPSPLPRFESYVLIPVRLRLHLKRAPVAGHNYRLELASLDLGIKRWAYETHENLHLSTPDQTLLLSYLANLIASKLSRKPS